MILKISPILPFLLSILIYVIVTYPLVFNFNSSIYSVYLGDSASILNFKKDGLIENFNDVVFTSMSSWVSNIAIYNLLVLIGFIFTYISSYHLFKELSKENQHSARLHPSIIYIFAAIITIAPIRLRYAMEWPDHANWGFIIMYLFFVVKLIKSFDTKYIYFASVFYYFATFNNYYHGVLILFATFIPLILVFLLKKKYRLIFIMTTTMFIASIPSIYIASIPRNTNGVSILELAFRTDADRFAYSARPWNYIIPDIYNPLLGDISAVLYYKIWSLRPYYLTEVFFPKEHSLFLGYSLLFLSSTFIIKSIRKDKALIKNSLYLFFLIVGLSAYILSMPPFIVLFNYKIYFPSQITPLILPQLRAFARFGLFVYISNTVFAFYGISQLYKHKKLRYLLPIIFIVTIIELVNFPPGLNFKIEIPSVYKYLENNDNNEYYFLMAPKAKDYTDVLFTNNDKFKPLNPYSKQDELVTVIENSIKTKDFCVFSNNYGIKYVINKKYDYRINYDLNNLKNYSKVSRYLKDKISNSWGNPIFGNHVPKSEEDLQKDRNEILLELDLKLDPKFNLVYQDDKYNVFEINRNYCLNINRFQ